MSAPQAVVNTQESDTFIGVLDTTGDDKDLENVDAATDPASEGGESAPATPVPSPSKAAVAPPPRPTPKPFKYDPKKITLRFIFANRDGVSVLVECEPTDTIGEVKGALLSMWPEDIPECSGGDKIRLICMGKGMLSPDSKTLEGCSVPVFKTHPTPVNVAVRPDNIDLGSSKKGSPKKGNPGSAGGGGSGANGASAPQPGSSGCACVIL